MNLDDLHRDFAEHIDMETRDNIERGMSPEAARAAAIRKFGNRGRITEDTYAVWHRTWIDRIRQDLHYAVRTLRKQPAFAAVAILTLALAIGLNTAVFSVVNAVLLRPLPYANAERLVWLSTYDERFKFDAVSGADFFDWRQQARSFEGMASYTFASMSLGEGGQSDQIGFSSVGDGFFAITGARPALGRLFSTADRNAILLTNRLFQRRFGGDSGVVGRTVTVNGNPYTVCGVLPDDYRFALPLEFPGLDIRTIEAYIRETMTPASQVRGGPLAIVNVVAKLKPGVRIPAARAELETIAANIRRAAPNNFSNDSQLRVLSMRDKLVGGSRRGLLVLTAAVGFVLLIACGNMANLLLARAGTRQREIAIRAAIGAGRARMVAQLLVEGAVLALAGGFAGLLVLRASFATIVKLGSHAVPRLVDATIDMRVLIFALLLSLLSGVIFGLGPALSLSRASLALALKDGARTFSAGVAGLRTRRFLMALQLALSVVLLTGAGLMIRSFWLMNARSSGFQPDRILTMKVALSGPAYGPKAAQIAYFARALEGLRGVPGVRAAGITNALLGGFIQAEGVQFPPSQQPRTTFHTVSSAYFPAMGMRLVRGRWVTDDEAAPAIMINESLARAVYGDRDPLGRRISIPGGAPGAVVTAAIVGIVGDLKYAKLDEEPAPETYVPYRYAPFLRGMNVVALVDGHVEALAGPVRQAVADADRTQPVYDVQTIEQALADSVAPRRFNLLLLAVFAAVALALAVIGVYGVMSYAVAQRSREIGVRMALGAQRSEVMRMVVGQGVAIALGGIVVGIAAAAGLTRLMASLLYGVRPTDPATFAAVCGILLGAAVLACAVPALRAARVDPVIALRYE
jgi:predicted permease